jgi:hypothetical protein
MPVPWQLRTARRKRRHPGQRPILEQLPTLDARMLARKRLFPPNWQDCFEYDFGFIVPSIRTLALTRGTAEILHSGKKQVVPIHWHRISGATNSQRPVFVCDCGRHVFRIYLVRGSFCCRRCSRAVYLCQAIASRQRPCLQTARLQRFLGAWSNTETLLRPAGMRRRTFSRLKQRLNQLEQRTRYKQALNSKRISNRMLLPVTAYCTQIEPRSV